MHDTSPPVSSMTSAVRLRDSWRFTSGERLLLAIMLLAILVFGGVLERRTALRNQPMTDLGVFACAARAVATGVNLYSVGDWHGWHYHYPPLMAILMRPFAHPLPEPCPELPPGVLRNTTNTPWGYELQGMESQYCPLSARNAHFFGIVAGWYLFSIALLLLAVHALACGLEGARLRDGLPPVGAVRRRWWLRRLMPMLIVVTSIGAELSRGQVDIVLLAAIAFALYFAVRGRHLAAGLCLIFPACVKLFPVLLGLWPLWRRHWAMLGGMLAGATLGLIVIPALAIGPARTVALYQEWVHVLLLPGLGASADDTRDRELTEMNSTDNQSLLAFFHNWSNYGRTLEERGSHPAAPAARVAVAVSGALLLAAACWAARWRRHENARASYGFAGLLTGIMLLLSPVTHSFYLVLLIPLLMTLVDFCLDNRATPRLQLMLAAILGVFWVVDLTIRLVPRDGVVWSMGLPVLCVLMLLAAGAWLLRGDTAERVI
ncbi:MAG: glycosyltransferase family 87 protein [bacterium]